MLILNLTSMNYAFSILADLMLWKLYQYMKYTYTPFKMENGFRKKITEMTFFMHILLDKIIK